MIQRKHTFSERVARRVLNALSELDVWLNDRAWTRTSSNPRKLTRLERIVSRALTRVDTWLWLKGEREWARLCATTTFN